MTAPGSAGGSLGDTILQLSPRQSRGLLNEFPGISSNFNCPSGTMSRCVLIRFGF